MHRRPRGKFRTAADRQVAISHFPSRAPKARPGRADSVARGGAARGATRVVAAAAVAALAVLEAAEQPAQATLLLRLMATMRRGTPRVAALARGAAARLAGRGTLRGGAAARGALGHAALGGTRRRRRGAAGGLGVAALARSAATRLLAARGGGRAARGAAVVAAVAVSAEQAGGRGHRAATEKQSGDPTGPLHGLDSVLGSWGSIARGGRPRARIRTG